MANIRDVDVKRFIWKNIVTLFGVPYVLISDNGLQFNSRAFKKHCSDLGIKNRYSTPAYPQGNGQVEAVNKFIVNGLKKRLDDAKGKWVEEPTTCPLDISNNALTVNRRDSFFNHV